MESKFPIPVLCEDLEKSSYIETFKFNLHDFDNSFKINDGKLFINLIIINNIFDSNLVNLNQVTYMAKVMTELKTIIIKSDGPIIDIIIDENELNNTETIEIKVFLVAKEEIEIKNNGCLKGIYSINEPFIIEESWVLAESNSYFIDYQRKGDSFFLVAKSTELKDKGFQIDTTQSNHIIIKLEPDLHNSVIELKRKENPYGKFIISSLLLNAVTVVLFELLSNFDDLEEYKTKEWFNLLSFSSKFSLGKDLQEIVQEIEQSNKDMTLLIEYSQKLINLMYSKSLITIAKEVK
jgi:hypothetical protein